MLKNPNENIEGLITLSQPVESLWVERQAQADQVSDFNVQMTENRRQMQIRTFRPNCTMPALSVQVDHLISII